MIAERPSVTGEVSKYYLASGSGRGSQFPVDFSEIPREISGEASATLKTTGSYRGILFPRQRRS